jgi:hypothetical protein
MGWILLRSLHHSNGLFNWVFMLDELGFYKSKFEVVRCSNWRSTVDADN